MGLTDRLKDLTKKAEDTAAEHKEQIQEAVQKAGTVADQRTGGRYSEQIQKVGAKVQTVVDRLQDPAEAAGGEAAEPGSTSGAESGAEGDRAKPAAPSGSGESGKADPGGSAPPAG